VRSGLVIAIPAAGASRRLGRPKQLVDIGGEPLIRRQCRVAVESGVGPVIVICGCSAESCAAEISDLSVIVVRNELWREGMASSIREAARAATSEGAAALLILHSDQYRITADDLRTLHAAWAAAGPSVACRSKCVGYSGPPVIVPARLFGTLLGLSGDQGARQVLSGLEPSSLREVDVPNAAHDLDVPAHLLEASCGDSTRS
jgi:CTP:molybdopterin cytidylyltransferase MocA